MNSLIIGLLFGLASALVTKNYRAFSKKPILETTLLFCFAYLSYVVSEVVHASGIITLLITGIIMAHYSWYNLSELGKKSTYVVFEFLGYAMEAFVFGYLGLTFFSYASLQWSPELFIVELAIILIGRAAGVFGTMLLFSLCCGYKSGLSIK
jgi:NhaP-type Na+/H+ or K+/H+ antiporter